MLSDALPIRKRVRALLTAPSWRVMDVLCRPSLGALRAPSERGGWFHNHPRAV
jgi:hypothetical protein